MPELINDWDPKRGVVVRYAVRCRRCGVSKKSDTPEVPEGWEEGTTPDADGRIPSQCPDCGK